MFVTIGMIKSSHGLRGEIKVSPESDHPDRLAKLPQLTVFVQQGTVREPYRVQEASVLQSYWRLKLAGVETRAQADALVGGELQIARDQVLPLPPGQYYVFQLIGMTVLTVQGEVLGKLVEVLQPGANDVYVVRSTERELLVPAIKQVVKSIDLASMQMVIDPLPGLFDPPEEEDARAD